MSEHYETSLRLNNRGRRVKSAGKLPLYRDDRMFLKIPIFDGTHGDRDVSIAGSNGGIYVRYGDLSYTVDALELVSVIANSYDPHEEYFDSPSRTVAEAAQDNDSP